MCASFAFIGTNCTVNFQKRISLPGKAKSCFSYFMLASEYSVLNVWLLSSLNWYFADTSGTVPTLLSSQHPISLNMKKWEGIKHWFMRWLEWTRRITYCISTSYGSRSMNSYRAFPDFWYYRNRYRLYWCYGSDGNGKKDCTLHYIKYHKTHQCLYQCNLSMYCVIQIEYNVNKIQCWGKRKGRK